MKKSKFIVFSLTLITFFSCSSYSPADDASELAEIECKLLNVEQGTQEYQILKHKKDSLSSIFKERYSDKEDRKVFKMTLFKKKRKCQKKHINDKMNKLYNH